MERPDKNDPDYAVKVYFLYREFIHYAYFDTGLAKPSVGRKFIPDSIKYELEHGKLNGIHMRDLNRLKSSLNIAFVMFSNKDHFQNVKQELLRLKSETIQVKSFAKMTEIVLKGRELVRLD